MDERSIPLSSPGDRLNSSTPHTIARTLKHLSYGCPLRYHNAGPKIPRKWPIQAACNCGNAPSQPYTLCYARSSDARRLRTGPRRAARHQALHPCPAPPPGAPATADTAAGGGDRRGPLTLISAPAGFGKSTLLSEWIHASGRPIAWVSLNEGDDEVSRFLLYVLSALQRLHPGLGEAALSTLRHAQAPTREVVEPLLTGLVNEIHTFDRDVLLVLDDYHVLSDAAVQQAADLARRSLRVAAEGAPVREAVSPGASMAYVLLAEVEREWNHLEVAAEHASRGTELGRRGGIADGLLNSSFVRMRILTAAGNFPGAFGALEQAEEVIRRTGQPHWQEMIEAFRARLLVRCFRVEGHAESLAAAVRWARDSGLLESCSSSPPAR